MEKINARLVTNELVFLKSSDDIQKFYKLVKQEDDFILEWEETKDSGTLIKKSELVIGSLMTAKLRNGEIKVLVTER